MNDLMKLINSSVIPYNCSLISLLVVVVVVVEDVDPFFVRRNHEYTFIFHVFELRLLFGVFVLVIQCNEFYLV